MSTHARRTLTAFTLAALAIAGLVLPACSHHGNTGAAGTDSTRPVPDTAPKRPADLTPPPAPSPGHT